MEPMPGKTGASNASNAAPFSHTRTCTLYMSNQTFIRLSSVSHPDRSMPCLRSFSVKFLFYILFYIMYARVWETGAALFALLALLACVSRGRLGGSKAYARSSAKWKAVPRCILWSPLFKALEKSRSAFSLLNFTDREHRVMKPSLSCLCRNRWRWQTPSVRIHNIRGRYLHPPNEPLLLSGINCLTCNL